jgi:MFS family permease
MNRAHAFWSFGFFASGMVSAAIAQTGLSPQLELVLMIPVIAVGAGTQAATRFFADSFVERYSPTSVARALLVVMAVGTLMVLFKLHPWVSIAGFALIGVGTSAIFPLAMSAAAQRTDRSAATNVAALAQTSFVAFLLGPPLLGYVGQAFGIEWSFGVGLPLIVLAFVLAPSLGRKPVPHAVDDVPTPPATPPSLPI